MWFIPKLIAEIPQVFSDYMELRMAGIREIEVKLVEEEEKFVVEIYILGNDQYPSLETFSLGPKKYQIGEEAIKLETRVSTNIPDLNTNNVPFMGLIEKATEEMLYAGDSNTTKIF